MRWQRTSLAAYKPVVERLEIERSPREESDMKQTLQDGRAKRVKASIWRLLAALPFDVDLDIPRLERAVRDVAPTLRRLCASLSEKRRAPLCRRRRRDVQ